MIYFIRRGEDGPVKIGFTTNLDKRLASLQGGNAEKLTVIRTMDGDKETERVLHGYFADQRLHGEWFEYSEEMLRVDAPAYVAAAPKPTTEWTLAQRLAAALRADFGHLKQARRVVAEITGCNESTVSNWMIGYNAPAAHHVINLARHSPAVLTVVLREMGEEPTVAELGAATARFMQMVAQR